MFLYVLVAVFGDLSIWEYVSIKNPSPSGKEEAEEDVQSI